MVSYYVSAPFLDGEIVTDGASLEGTIEWCARELLQYARYDALNIMVGDNDGPHETILTIENADSIGMRYASEGIDEAGVELVITIVSPAHVPQELRDAANSSEPVVTVIWGYPNDSESLAYVRMGEADDATQRFAQMELNPQGFSETTLVISAMAQELHRHEGVPSYAAARMAHDLAEYVETLNGESMKEICSRTQLSPRDLGTKIAAHAMSTTARAPSILGTVDVPRMTVTQDDRDVVWTFIYDGRSQTGSHPRHKRRNPERDEFGRDQNLYAVRTKTGDKIHLATPGSSRTVCGARVAQRLRRIHDGAQPCLACGCPADVSAMREHLPTQNPGALKFYADNIEENGPYDTFDDALEASARAIVDPGYGTVIDIGDPETGSVYATIARLMRTTDGLELEIFDADYQPTNTTHVGEWPVRVVHRNPWSDRDVDFATNPAGLTVKGNRMYKHVLAAINLKADATKKAAKRTAAQTVVSAARRGVPGLVRKNPEENPPRVYRAQKVVAKLERDARPTLPARGSVVTTPDVFVRDTLADYIGDNATESFVAVFLNIRNQVVGYTEYNSGGIHGVEVNVSGIVRDALTSGAAAIITAHNHPSGDPAPSDDDRRLWKRLREAAGVVGIPVLDNLVVGEGGRFYSQAAEES